MVISHVLLEGRKYVVYVDVDIESNLEGALYQQNKIV